MKKLKNIMWIVNILSHVGWCAWLIDWFWIGWLDLLTPYTHSSGLQAITALSLFPHFTGHCYTQTLGFSVFTSCILATYVTVLLSLQITHEVFFSQRNSFLAISSQLFCQLQTPETRLNSLFSRVRSLLYTLRVDPQKTLLPLLLYVESLLQRYVYQTVA
jgi:hypothetical protein